VVRLTQTVDIPYTGEQLLDVYAPASGDSRPLVVLFHGGDNTKATVARLAAAIAERGAVVFVPTYYSQPYSLSVPMLQPLEEAACAVRFARAHASEYGARSDRVIVAGHSYGGAIGSTLMLAGDDFHRSDCLVQEGSALPDAFVGLDGAYDIIDHAEAAVLQARPAESIQSNPYTYIGRTPRRENVSFVLFVGPTYQVLQEDNQASRDALREAGYDVRLFFLPGVNHWQFGLPQPPTVDAIASLFRP
jgi:acetyl esterase/lipase